MTRVSTGFVGTVLPAQQRDNLQPVMRPFPPDAWASFAVWRLIDDLEQGELSRWSEPQPAPRCPGGDSPWASPALAEELEAVREAISEAFRAEETIGTSSGSCASGANEEALMTSADAAMVRLADRAEGLLLVDGFPANTEGCSHDTDDAGGPRSRDWNRAVGGLVEAISEMRGWCPASSSSSSGPQHRAAAAVAGACQSPPSSASAAIVRIRPPLPQSAQARRSTVGSLPSGPSASSSSSPSCDIGAAVVAYCAALSDCLSAEGARLLRRAPPRSLATLLPRHLQDTVAEISRALVLLRRSLIGESEVDFACRLPPCVAVAEDAGVAIVELLLRLAAQADAAGATFSSQASPAAQAGSETALPFGDATGGAIAALTSLLERELGQRSATAIQDRFTRQRQAAINASAGWLLPSDHALRPRRCRTFRFRQSRGLLGARATTLACGSPKPVGADQCYPRPRSQVDGNESPMPPQSRVRLNGDESPFAQRPRARPNGDESPFAPRPRSRADGELSPFPPRPRGLSEGSCSVPYPPAFRQSLRPTAAAVAAAVQEANMAAARVEALCVRTVAAAPCLSSAASDLDTPPSEGQGQLWRQEAQQASAPFVVGASPKICSARSLGPSPKGGSPRVLAAVPKSVSPRSEGAPAEPESEPATAIFKEPLVAAISLVAGVGDCSRIGVSLAAKASEILGCAPSVVDDGVLCVAASAGASTDCSAEAISSTESGEATDSAGSHDGDDAPGTAAPSESPSRTETARTSDALVQPSGDILEVDVVNTTPAPREVDVVNTTAAPREAEDGVFALPSPEAPMPRLPS